MAYTRIHAIKATVDRSIAYICNPDKTDGELFVSSYGCSARTAALHLIVVHFCPPHMQTPTYPIISTVSEEINI